MYLSFVCELINDGIYKLKNNLQFIKKQICSFNKLIEQNYINCNKYNKYKLHTDTII